MADAPNNARNDTPACGVRDARETPFPWPELRMVEDFLPDRLTDIRSWQGHIPFAYWLVDLLRPAVFVELGTHRGDSYCAFCQAVNQLSSPTKCFSVDTWKGDPQAGYYGEAVFQELEAYHRERYSSFSTLLRMSFDEARDLFQDNSIDLLHIDGHHTYASVRHDVERWRPKLSSKGVVLLHDTQVYSADFGVREIFRELAGTYPHFEFYHSNGLGVLGIGDRQHSGMQALFTLSRPRADEFRAFFGQTGGKTLTRNRQMVMSMTPPGNAMADGEPAGAGREVTPHGRLICVKPSALDTTPAISVVMPAFNHERFVADSIQSVLTQSLGDFELIIIDDGSKDKTLEIVSGVKDPRVAVYRQENEGAAATINKGLGLARGKYLSILNSDDIYAPHRLFLLSRFLDNNPDIDFVASLLQPIDRNGDEVTHGAAQGDWLLWYQAALAQANEERALIHSLIARNYVVTTSNYFFRRNVFEENPPFRNDLRYCHDYEFIVRAGRRHGFRLVREFLLKYRLHETNTINENAFLKNLEMLHVIFSNIGAGELFSASAPEDRLGMPVIRALRENPVVNQAETAEKTIAELQAHIHRYDEQRQRYDSRLEEYHLYSAELQGSIKELNERLIGMNDELQATHGLLNETKERASSQEAEIESLNQSIERKDSQLHEIYSSRGWRWLTRFRRLKQALNVKQILQERFRRGRVSPQRIEVGYPLQPHRPKVVHVIANMLTGGSSQLVVDLIRHLGHEYDQEVITSHMPSPPAYSGFPCRQIVTPRSARDLAALLKEKNTAILHIHYWGECDEPWYRFFFEAAKLLDCRVIENINTPVAPFRHPRVTHYVFVSRHARELASPVPPNASVIYPGSDFSLFSRNGSPVPDDAIGMVYRLEPDKLNPEAIDVFIEVVKERPRTRCHIIGGGTYLETYRERVARAGLSEQFVFTGYVPYSDLPEYYKKLSVFVAPVWKESFGQVSPFAMSMEIPVAGYEVGALSEILGNTDSLGKTTDELKDIICELLDKREKRIEIGIRNRKRAVENFSLESMIEAYRELYTNLLKT